MKFIVHRSTKSQLQAITNQPNNSYIFYGASHVGKHTAALWLVHTLCCQNHNEPCPLERAILQGGYPDLITIAPDKAGKVGIGTIQQVQETLSRSPYYNGGYRVVLIDQAGRLTPEAQNCLLKTIEEPPDRTIVILVATELQTFLPTVLSRCKQVFFPPLEKTAVRDYLVNEQDLAISKAEELAAASEGLPGVAIGLTQDSSLHEYQERLNDDRQHLTGDKLFERLILAGKLGDDSEYAIALLQRLARYYSDALRSDAATREDVATYAHNLQIIEKTLRSIVANVTPRAALEGLTLELIC